MKNFLKITFVFLSLLVSTTVKGQEEITFTDLQQMVATVNSQLPMSLGTMMEWQSMEISKQQLTMRYSVNDIGNTISKNLMTNEEMKEQFRVMMGGLDDELRVLFHVISSFGINTLVVATSENTGDSNRLLITAKEMEEALNTEVTTEEMLQLQVRNSQKTLPLPIASGCNITEIKLTSTYMVNTVIVDESIVSMNQLLSNKNSMRESMTQMILNNSDIMANMLLLLCADTGRGYSYVYKGNTSGKIVRIDFSNEQLIKIFESMDSQE